MSAANRIRDVLKDFDEAYDDANVWKVQGTPVISHKTLERVAAKAKIRFDLPTIVRAERDEAVIMVVGTRGEQREWSIGEALVNVNYRVSGKQAGYVWAMAEKRAKDRVILKLIELHGFAYSEEEADDFKNAPRETAAAPQSEVDQGAVEYVTSVERQIAAGTDPGELIAWWNSADEKQARRDFGLSQQQATDLKNALMKRIEALSPQREAAQ